MVAKKKFWIVGAMSSLVVGVVGGVFGAFLSVSSPALVSSNTAIASEPVTIKPGMPILLFKNGETYAEVEVDRNGLTLLNLTTKTGQNQIALGMLGDSQLQLGVFDSTGKAKAGLGVPMNDSAKVHMLLLDKKPNQPGVTSPTES